MSKVFLSLNDYRTVRSPVTCTLGTMDGVHLGHRALIQRTIEAAGQDGESVALTLSRHPAQVLNPNEAPPPICSLNHKLRLLEETNISAVVLLDFDEAFSQQSAEEFLMRLRKHIPFQALVLGHDARFGKDRGGTPETVTALAQRENFSVEYLDEVSIDETPVSSTRIRACISKGDLSEAGRLLGRPYSIRRTVIAGRSAGEGLGFPTANIEVADLCLPPYGVYAAKARIADQATWTDGVVNLGLAPTFRDDNVPLLEVHFLSRTGNLYGQELEVQLIRYIRPEQAFPSPEALKAQIAADLQAARKILGSHLGRVPKT